MPVLTQRDLNRLRGLQSSDRSQEDQRAIDNVMGYRESPSLPEINISSNDDDDDQLEELARIANRQRDAYMYELHRKYDSALAERRSHLNNAGQSNFVNMPAKERMQSIADNVSSHYKRYKGTDLLNLPELKGDFWGGLAAKYDTDSEIYGEDYANIELDKMFKRIVGNNQSWLEQWWNGGKHLIPAIEGGAIQAFGNVYGAFNHALKLVDNATTSISEELAKRYEQGYQENKSDDLGLINGFLDEMLDNPITRYGRDVERAGTSNVVQGFLNLIGVSDETAQDKINAMKATRTKYNPEGLGQDAIITTPEQDEHLINTSTPWIALQSGGFTALSMLMGFGEAKAAGMLFNGIAKGMTWANRANKAFKTAETLEKGLKVVKRAQNMHDMFVTPAILGSMEGAVEGLNTKIEVEQDGLQKLDDTYRETVNREAEELYKTGKYETPEQAFNAAWDNHKEDYVDARRQIEWAASHAGINNFFANSAINGIINSTFKAGILHPRTQEAIRNSRLFGWAYRTSRFNVKDGVATPARNAIRDAMSVIKEPFGEGFEEYMQSITGDVTSSIANSTIGDFIANRFDVTGDGTAKVGEYMGNEIGAAWTAFKGSLTSKESLESAILGAVSSTMGTVGGVSRAYKMDKNGKVVTDKDGNAVKDNNIFRRGLKREGNEMVLESWLDVAKRITPIRSGLVNNYNKLQEEKREEEAIAESLTEWLRNPDNRKKWDGGVGTANWLSLMQESSESNDQFGYRTAKMGKTINDVFMISRLKGTDMYDSIMEDLHRSATLEKDSEGAQNLINQVRESGGEEYENKSDEEIIEKIQKNANKMLGIMSQVEEKGKYYDGLLGRVDEDTKQGLIFGDIMKDDFIKRRESLSKEVERLKEGIENSREGSHPELPKELKEIIVKHGSLSKAIKAAENLESQEQQLTERIKELKAIKKDNRSEEQNKELENSEKALQAVRKTLKGYKPLMTKDSDGIPHIDSSLHNLVLNEQEIMELDPTVRGQMLREGAARYWNATHQNLQKVEKLNEEIDDLQKKIDELEAKRSDWTKPDGKAKKRKYKQVEKLKKNLEVLNKQKAKKLRELNQEQGNLVTKPAFNDEQQAVIDNLVAQGTNMDPQFLDKVENLGRIEAAINSHSKLLQDILSDRRAFANYIQRAKETARINLTKLRAERIAGIEDFEEYSQELDKILANASPAEMKIIWDTLAREDYNAKREEKRRREKESLDNWNGEDQLEVGEDGEIRVAEKENTQVEESSQENAGTDNAATAATAENTTAEVAAEAVPETANSEEENAVIGSNNPEGKVEPPSDEKPSDTGIHVELERSNYDRYLENMNTRAEFIGEMEVNESLTNNDRSLLYNALQYLQSKGVDPSDRDRAVETLLEEDEQGIVGGMFRQWVEKKNAAVPEQMRTHMPYFTSIGQVVNQYVDVLTGMQEAAIDRSIATPEIVINAPEGAVVTPDPGIQPERKVTPAPSTDDSTVPPPDNNGTVGTGDQAKIVVDSQEEVKNAKHKAIVDKAVEIFGNYISNAGLSSEVKALAKQYFDKASVNSETKYSIMDDIIKAIREQVSELSSNIESGGEVYEKAAGALRAVAARLSNPKNQVGRHDQDKGNPERGSIRLSNVTWLKETYGDIWEVRFAEKHNVSGWNAEHDLTPDTPLYFLTNSAWTAEVMSEMGKDYIQSNNLPVVVAVRLDEAPKNPNNTTAIEVETGVWYQPVGFLPSTDSKYFGANRTRPIRAKASQEPGIRQITADGLPNGKLLTTRISGPGNYRHATHIDADTRRENAPDNNSDVRYHIITTLSGIPQDEKARLLALSPEELINDNVYKDLVSKFIEGLSWVDSNDVAGYTYERYRDGGEQNPMFVYGKYVEGTTNAEGKTIGEVLQDGNLDAIRDFNSTTQKLFAEIIRPMYYYALDDKIKGQNALLIMPNSEVEDEKAYVREALDKECERLAKWLNGYSKDSSKDGSEESKEQYIPGIRSLIYPSKDITFKVISGQSVEEQQKNLGKKSVYKIIAVKEGQGQEELGTITVQKDSNISDVHREAESFLKNLLEKRQWLNLKWQLGSNDVKALKTGNNKQKGRAIENITRLVNDGLLEFAGSSLSATIHNITINAPIDDSDSERIIYPSDIVANPENAVASSPMNGGGVETVINKGGETVDPESGAVLDDEPKNPPKEDKKEHSEAWHKANAIADQIARDSERFELDSDEKYYYVKDLSTGKETRYLRVTSTISADWGANVVDIYKHLNGIKGNLSKKKVKEIEELDTIDKFSQATGFSEQEIKKAISELEKKDYGAWEVPSSKVGNTVDTITRDFFEVTFETKNLTKSDILAKLKEKRGGKKYPNITEEWLDKFVTQLIQFKASLDSKGITIKSNKMVAHGDVTVTDVEGKTKTIKVAGTLDLFGFDENGNFYIFDMKTTHNHSEEKLEKERGKWSRQISLYAQLLEQLYPGVKFDSNNLRIIPINVDYPNPIGKGSSATVKNGGVVYSKKEGDEDQLMKQQGSKPKEEFKDSNPEMRFVTDEQFVPGRKNLNIVWDSISDEAKELAGLIEEEAKVGKEGDPPINLQTATVETPPSPVSNVTSGLGSIGRMVQENGGKPAGQKPQPVPTGLPAWEDLDEDKRAALIRARLITGSSPEEYAEDYQDALKDAALDEALYNDLKNCLKV